MTDEIIKSDSSELIITPELKAKSSKEIHNSLEIHSSLEKTFIIVAAIHKEIGKNFVNKISCKKGLPIGGYTYDSQSDSYYFECADYFHLGYVPISFFAKIKATSDWQVRIPMTENVIKRYLTSLQKKELKNFKNIFKSEEYNFQYIQMIDPNW